MRALTTALVLTVVSLAAGCLNADTSTLPDTDAAEATPGQLLASGTFEGESKSESFAWDSAGSYQAELHVETNLTQGHVTVRVRDHNAIPVFERTFRGATDGDAVSNRGRPGSWIVEVIAEGAAGEWELKVKSPPVTAE